MGGRLAQVTLFGPGVPAEGRTIPIGPGDFTLGRDPASSLILDDRQISRRHARLHRGPSGWEIHDLGSSNGVRVNGHRMEAALLSGGEEVRIGPFRLAFSADPVAPGPPLPARRPPPPPSPAGRGRAILVAGLAVAVLLPALLAGISMLSGKGPPRGAAGAVAPPEPTPAAPLLPDEPLPAATAWPPPPDPAVKAEVDRAAASLEAALRAGNVDGVFVHVHPAATADLQAAFEPRRAELSRVATLLATRRLVVAEEAWAEYEVTEGGRTFAVVFEKVEGRWLLASL